MLPPMAIFFPLFTLLEDVGYLPRVAFHLDHAFQCARASGKQSLTMCMGFGCNACGVSGCRIIDSPRERLVNHPHQQLCAVNGRFPLLIFLCSVFFAGSSAGGALLLTGVIAASVGLTLLMYAHSLSNGFAREAVSFCAQAAAVPHAADWARYLRSVRDRTLFVLESRRRGGLAACSSGFLPMCR